MKKFIFYAIFVMAVNQLSAQVGIGTSTPDASAILDLTSSKLGFLLPRVSLLSQNDTYTIGSPQTSLLVYNTNTTNNNDPTSDVSPGYYYWNGGKWIMLNGNVWSQTGNAGTTSSNFIGTLDGQPLTFRMNNIQSGLLDQTRTYFGFSAGLNDPGNSGNSAFGNSALQYNQTGNANTAFGLNSLVNNISGSCNVALGTLTMLPMTSGDSNTAVGYKAGPSVSGLTNSSAVGNNAQVATSNTMSFGNGQVTGWAFGLASVTQAGAVLQVGTPGRGNGAYLTAGGAWTNGSDINTKDRFSEIDDENLMNKIERLDVRQWYYKGTQEKHIGPVAQDFYKLFGLGTSDDKHISTIDPAGIALRAIKCQQRMIHDLQTENEALKERLAQIESLLSKNGIH